MQTAPLLASQERSFSEEAQAPESTRRPRSFIHVISMANALDRRAEFAGLAQNARSSWAFVDASTSAPADLPYDERAAARRFGRRLTRAEVGSFASHWQAWRALLQSTDEQRIILEDDVLVDWRALDRLVEVDFAELGLDLVRLYSTHPFQHRLAIRRFLGPHQHLVQARGMFLGTQGYVLTRRAARRLVDLAAPIGMPVDWFLSRYWELGFPNFCLFPFPIVEKAVPSNIGDRSESPPIDRSDWIVRQCVRVGDRLARAFADRVRFRENPFPSYPDAGPSFVERTEQERSTMPKSQRQPWHDVFAHAQTFETMSEPVRTNATAG